MYDAREGLRELSYDLSLIIADESIGERYHENYKKNKVAFKELITREIALRRAIRSWQLETLKAVPDLVNWAAFRQGDRKNLLKPEQTWHKYKTELEDILRVHIQKAVSIGFLYGESQLGHQVNLSAAGKDLETELTARVRKSADSIMQTLQDRLTRKLTNAIDERVFEAREFPEDIDEDLVDELENVADDHSKADGISSTEIVGAVMFGLLMFSGQADGGVKTKTWRTQQDRDVDDICLDLEGETVPIDETFGEYDAPPDPHNNCRCYLDIDEEFTDPTQTRGIDERGRTTQNPQPPNQPLQHKRLQGNMRSELSRSIANKFGYRDDQAFGTAWLDKYGNQLQIKNVNLDQLSYLPGIDQSGRRVLSDMYYDRLPLSEPPPIIIDGRVIIDGTNRVMALRKAGRKIFPAIDISGIYKVR